MALVNIPTDEKKLIKLLIDIKREHNEDYTNYVKHILVNPLTDTLTDNIKIYDIFLFYDHYKLNINIQSCISRHLVRKYTENATLSTNALTICYKNYILMISVNSGATYNINISFDELSLLYCNIMKIIDSRSKYIYNIYVPLIEALNEDKDLTLTFLLGNNFYNSKNYTCALEAFNKSIQSTSNVIKYNSILSICIINAILNNDNECMKYFNNFIDVVYNIDSTHIKKNYRSYYILNNYLIFDNCDHMNEKLISYLMIRKIAHESNNYPTEEYKLIIYTMLFDKTLFNQNKNTIIKCTWYKNFDKLTN